jgi:hypothetical protein
MDNVNSQNIKDQNVLSYMMQLVQEKYSDDVEFDFLNQEADRLYDLFGNNLVQYFEPMLTVEQKQQFEELLKKQTSQDALLSFLIQAIPDLEGRIMQVLGVFRTQYLAMSEDRNKIIN